MTVASTIAIDGPAGSGKTVVGRAVAERLGYLFLDTGALYRALTYLALQRGVAPDDEARLAALARQAVIDVVPDGPADGRPYTVLADGDDVTWQIRLPEVNAAVSVVSACPGVRKESVAAQRRVASRGHCVLSGRDIGTVVLPDADLKVFLTASLDERVQRRLRELVARGEPATEAVVRADLERRDHLDSGRAASPLQVAPGAHVLDSTDLSIEQVVARIVAWAAGRAA